MRKLFTLFAALLIINDAEAQIVNTQFGQIQGSVNGTVHEFLGIPFAAPPVDTLRWKAPKNPAAWANVLTTTSFAPVCPQKKFVQGDTTYTLTGNEDCLYLNIWTPQVGTASLPGMVFIHGAVPQQSSASEIQAGPELYH